MSPQDEPLLHSFPDRAIRRMLEQPGNLRDLVTAIVPDLAAHLDFELRELLGREFLLEDWRGRESDLVFRVPYRTADAEQPVLLCLLLEHQSVADPRMPLRMLLYAVLYWEREWKAWEERHEHGEPLRMTPVLPVVFHTGEHPWATNRTFAELLGGPEELRRFAPQWEPLFWDLAEQDPAVLRQSTAAWLQALSVVRTERDEFATLCATLADVLPHLVELRQQDNIRGHDLLWFVLSWVLRRRPRAERDRLRDLMRTQIRDQELQNEVDKMGKLTEKTYDEEWVDVVRSREKAAGISGAISNSRETLREQLQERFGTVPESVAQRIEACTDMVRLKAALRQIMHINSPDELVV